MIRHLFVCLLLIPTGFSVAQIPSETVKMLESGLIDTLEPVGSELQWDEPEVPMTPLATSLNEEEIKAIIGEYLAEKEKSKAASMTPEEKKKKAQRYSNLRYSL